jgi:hypothetical protein
MAVGAIWGTVIMMTVTNVYYAEKQSGGNMAKHMTEKDWAAIRLKHSKMTKEEAKAFLREVMGPPTKELEGQDKKEAMLILSFLEPFEESNNQHSWTSSYMVGETRYDVTSWPGSNDPTIAEYLPE